MRLCQGANTVRNFFFHSLLQRFVRHYNCATDIKEAAFLGQRS